MYGAAFRDNGEFSGNDDPYGFGSNDNGGNRWRRSNRDATSPGSFADPADAYHEQFRRGEVDEDRNASYVSFDAEAPHDVDHDTHRSPLRDYQFMGDGPRTAPAAANTGPSAEQLKNLFAAIGSSSASSSGSYTYSYGTMSTSSTSASAAATPKRPADAAPPPRPEAKGNAGSHGMTSSSASTCSSSKSHRRRRRRKRKTPDSATPSGSCETLGSATTTSASEQQFLFSDEESPRTRRRSRKQQRASDGKAKPSAAEADKATQSSQPIVKFAALPQVQRVNDERQFGTEMAHDIELDMDDSSCEELERELIGHRLREETLRAAQAQDGVAVVDRLREADSSGSATDDVMAGRMRALNVRERQLFVSTDDESDTAENRQAAKACGPDEILARHALPGTASAAGQAMNCFICGYTRENAAMVNNNDLRQLFELFYNPNGSDLKRHARAVHVFYKTRIWRNAEWRQQRLPLWRTRDVYVCLTKHQVEPRLVMRKHLSILDTLIASTVAAAHVQGSNGQLVPHRDNLRISQELMKSYWMLAKIDPSKTNFYQARATPTVHAYGPYHLQTVRTKMTTSLSRRSRLY